MTGHWLLSWWRTWMIAPLSFVVAFTAFYAYIELAVIH
jgi:hypothetical protein